jgi:hypothetical protein
LIETIRSSGEAPLFFISDNTFTFLIWNEQSTNEMFIVLFVIEDRQTSTVHIRFVIFNDRFIDHLTRENDFRTKFGYNNAIEIILFFISAWTPPEWCSRYWFYWCFLYYLHPKFLFEFTFYGFLFIFFASFWAPIYIYKYQLSSCYFYFYISPVYIHWKWNILNINLLLFFPIQNDWW